MPFRIRQQLLDTSIYLYPDEGSAADGARVGGSGFIVGLPLEGSNGAFTLWAVTNRHVIEQGNWTIRLNSRSGGFECIDTDDTQWLYHPEGDDLAVRFLPMPRTAQSNFVPLDMMLTQQMAEILDIGPADSAFVIGRFIAADGKQKNTPTVRFGQIAQCPTENIRYDEYDQKMWLVEVKSLNGYSGAPAFVWLDTMYYREDMKGLPGPNPQLGNCYDHKGQIMGRGRYDPGPFLLGVDCCMIPLWQKVCDGGGQELQSGMKVPLNTGMMGVIPAWRLIDMLNANPAKPHIEDMALASIAADQQAIATNAASA